MATAAAAATVKKKKAQIWAWTGVSKDGAERQGEMEASDAESVQGRLRQMGINPTKVKKKPIAINIDLSFGRVPRKSLIIFTRQLATMIDAGLPLVQCLDILYTQQDHPGFKKCIGEVKAKVESGSTFADALRDHPKIFDDSTASWWPPGKSAASSTQS